MSDASRKGGLCVPGFLSAVMFSLAIVRRSTENPDAHKALGRATRALNRSQEIVRGIFDFARAGARPATNARALGDGVRAALEELAEANPAARPEVQVEPFEDRQIACAPVVFGVIMRNLLGNAAKYMKKAPVQRIWVRAKALGDKVRVEVQDTGPGLPPGLERIIFEPYVRAAPQTQPGIGLGLATVKKLAEAHGGSVGVRRPSEGGAAFWFELPLAPGQAEDAKEAGGARPVDTNDQVPVAR